jgi:hypothetical protein
MCHITLGHDHRLVDGADAGRFLAFVKERPRELRRSVDVSRPLEVHWLGTVPYADGLDLQKRLVEQRKDRCDSRSASPSRTSACHYPWREDAPTTARNIVATPEALENEGVEVF